MKKKLKWISLALFTLTPIATVTAIETSSVLTSTNQIKLLASNDDDGVVILPNPVEKIPYGQPIVVDANFSPESYVAGYRWAKIVNGKKTILPETGRKLVYIPLPDEREFDIELTFIFVDGTNATAIQKIIIVGGPEITPPPSSSPTIPPTTSEPVTASPLFWTLIAVGSLWILILITTIVMNITKHSKKKQ